MTSERVVAWLFTIARSTGASFPGSASLVHLLGELKTAEIQRRLDALEDPISQIHPDVRRLAERLYSAVRASNKSNLDFDDDFYDEFARPLAALDAAGHVKASYVLAQHRPIGIRIVDPTFMLYMVALSDDAQRAVDATEAVDDTEPRRWINGEEVAAAHDLPLPVIEAIFKVYEANGYGIRSKTMGESSYYPKV